MKRCRETLHHYYIITFIGVFWVMSPVILLSSIYMLTLYNPSSMCPFVCPSLLSHPWCPAAELSVAVQYITLSHTRFTVISISPFQQFQWKGFHDFVLSYQSLFSSQTALLLRQWSLKIQDTSTWLKATREKNIFYFLFDIWVSFWTTVLSKRHLT